MYLVAIAWLYVVLMMALAEALSPQGSVPGAFFTLLLYGAMPVAVVLYIMGAPHRRRARKAAERAERAAASAHCGDADGRPDPPPGDGPAGDTPFAADSDAASPDRSGHAPRDAVATVRKEA